MAKTLILSIILLFSTSLNIYAQNLSMQDTYTLEADQVSRVGEDTYVATGDVILKAKDLEFRANKLTYNSKTQEIDAEGSVHIISSIQELKAEKITYNISKETGTAENIQGFLAPFNYICAKKMYKTGPTTFNVYDAKISTCSGRVPDWSVSMYSGNMKLGGYMQVNHATTNILDTPFVYIPKLFYPVSTKRQTGLLVPIIGYSNDMGMIGNFRYFIAPDIDYDFTVGLGLYSERGVQPQFEARYAMNNESHFYLSGEYIHDFNSESDIKDRWRTALSNNYVPIKNLSLNISGDYASDYLYLRDYSDYSIADINQNSMNMFFAETSIKYTNDFIDAKLGYRRDMQFRDTVTGFNSTIVEHQPSFRVNKIIKDIPYIFLEYDLSYNRIAASRNVYFANNAKPNNINQDQHELYNRFGAYSKLYTPIDAKIATITPSAYIGYVLWNTENTPFSDTIGYESLDFGGVYFINNELAYKYYGGIGLTIAFKEIYRNYENFRHSINNRLTFGYSPKIEQKGIPDFFSDDITKYEGAVYYEFINTLIGKNWNVNFNIKQGYDILQKENAILPLETKLYFNIFNYLYNTTEIYYKHSGPLKKGEHRFQYFTNTTTIKFLKYFYFEGSYTYDTRIYRASPNSNINNTKINLNTGINIWRFALTGGYEWAGYNEAMSVNNLIPTTRNIALLYNAECWSLGAKADFSDYTVNSIDGKYKRNEAKFYLMFSLKGLGDSTIEFLNINQ